jgi:hypothetical protein
MQPDDIDLGQGVKKKVYFNLIQRGTDLTLDDFCTSYIGAPVFEIQPVVCPSSRTYTGRKSCCDEVYYYSKQ